MDTRTPEQTIALLATLGLAIVGVIQLIRWLFSGPKSPDPWDQTTADAIEPDSFPICHRCITEHPDSAHFCSQCGAAVGDFNNVLPFEKCFSIGEVFRNGTGANMPPTFLRLAGYFLLSTAAYSFFAPIYWFFLVRNLTRRTELVLVDDSDLPPVLPK